MCYNFVYCFTTIFDVEYWNITKKDDGPSETLYVKSKFIKKSAFFSNLTALLNIQYNNSHLRVCVFVSHYNARYRKLDLRDKDRPPI